MTTQCGQIREVIRRAGKPLAMAEIMVEFAPEARRMAAQQVCVMARNGILVRYGTGRLDYTYDLGRDPKAPRVVKDDAYRESMRAKWRDWAAQQRARRKAGLLPPKRAKKTPMPKPLPKPAPRANPKPARPLVLESLPPAAPQKVVRAQTVAEFLAAGGNIERLPNHAVSKPLRKIGPND